MQTARLYILLGLPVDPPLSFSYGFLYWTIGQSRRLDHLAATSLICGILVAGGRHAVDVRGEGENPPWPIRQSRLPSSASVRRRKEKLCGSEHPASRPGQLLPLASPAEEKGALKKSRRYGEGRLSRHDALKLNERQI